MRPDERLDDEIRHHLELLAAEHEARGMSPAQARDAARRAFGGIEPMKELHRDQRQWRRMRALASDVRDVARSLARTPAFTLPVLLSLAFAMGANVAAFSVLNTLVLRPLPVADPDRLFHIQYVSDAGVTEGGNYTWFERLRDGTPGVAAAFIAHRRGNVKVVVDNDVEALSGLQVSGAYFSGMGLTPQAGRLISSADEADGAAVAVISDGYWTRRFGRDPGAIGRTVRVDDRPHVVIGVTRPGHFGPEVGRQVDVTLPIDRDEYRRGWVSMALIVRLAANAAPPEVAVALTTRLRAFADSLPTPARDRFLAMQVVLTPMANGLSTEGSTRDRLARPSVIAASLIGLMLLVATANWAMLLLARASAKQREAAVRCALGSTRFRLARQLIVENVCLALVAGAIGLVAAAWLVEVLPGNGLPPGLEIRSDGRVVLFTVGLALLMGALLSAGPVWMTRRIGSGDLRTTTVTPDRRGARAGQMLVVAQVAVSVVVVAAAGFFGATVRSLQGREMGFTGDNVITFALDADGTGLEGGPLAETHRRVVQQLRTIDGVVSATVAKVSPLSGTEDGKGVTVPGFAPRADDDLNVNANEIGPDFFSTFGIPLLRGRAITADDQQGAPQVALLNESAARFYFGDRDPLGSRIEVRGAVAFSAQIVGIVPDVLYDSLRAQADRMVYLPFFQRAVEGEYVLAVRTAPGREPFVLRDIPRAVHAVAPGMPVLAMGTLARQVNERAASERLLAGMSGVLGALALLLAAIGIYGIVAYTVVRRTTELGLRAALGATPADLLWRVTSGTVAVVAVGILLGVAIAAGASGLVTSMLYGVERGDPRVYGTAAVALLLTAMAAALPPVIRTLRFDPVAALRSE